MIDYSAQFRAYCEGVTFAGRRFDHTPGAYVTGVDGLAGGGTTSYESIPSGVGDGLGEHDTPNVRTGPRVITLTGFLYERSMRDLGYSIRRLDGLVRDSAVFSWEEYGETFSTGVRRGSGGSVRRRGSTRFADFTIRFRAPSQLYYGELHTAGPGASIVLPNRGNEPARPILTMTGTATSYKLTSGGVEYVVGRSLAGRTHTVDMRDLILLEDGVAVPGAVTSARRILIPKFSPGATVAAVPTGGTIQLSGKSADTFV